MDSGTNPGTMKKQTREKLKQLEKDEEVFKQLMADLGLPEGAILKVMALPNISMETLEKQLEPRTFKGELGEGGHFSLQRLDAAFEELAAVLSVGRRGAEGPGGDSGIGENSGRVPPPLPLDDFVVFTDYDPHMRNVLADKLARLDILPQEKQQRITDECVRRIEDLPAFKGTEKAVVVYVGRLEAPRNGILRALTSKLRDVMSLCQGRLVLALDVDVLDHDPGELRRPYQLEMELALQEAEKRHGLTG
nr:hypothetical protein BaRGS_027924 [Batillaria attramentaria]